MPYCPGSVHGLWTACDAEAATGVKYHDGQPIVIIRTLPGGMTVISRATHLLIILYLL
jgi:hypothetical protein